GDSIKKESKAYIRSNGTVPEGDAITAKPGNLPCQMLVHAVGLLRRFGNNGEEVKLRKVILKCLELTDRNNYSSIAIPALGAGNSGYPTDRSVCTIINSIQIYFKSKEDKFSNIKKIYFCDIEEKIVMAFIECFRRNFGNRIEEIYGEKDLDIGNRKCRELSVEVRQGDITQEKTDAIVSCISESLNFNVGK
ncbi:uncharacterized protein TM_0508-like, partial [Saccostrea cucullata]|uniref:uncharacterized protein TM_0508-like n=1 Tax=Saccostrea cuccullata TaxID=36930 RepID=UPI002ECFEF7E